jgi:plastocyanin
MDNNTTSTGSNPNSNTMKIVVVLVVLVVLIGGVVWLMNMNNQPVNTNTGTNTTPESTTPANTDNNSANNQTETTAPSAAETTTITYDGNNFSPAESTVKAGGTVKVVNNSSGQLSFVSDPHPTHTLNSELNVGDVEAGQTKSVTLNNKGTWGFHNHYKSSSTGKITVE